jgi:hypothetical protein
MHGWYYATPPSSGRCCRPAGPLASPEMPAGPLASPNMQDIPAEIWCCSGFQNWQISKLPSSGECWVLFDGILGRGRESRSPDQLLRLSEVQGGNALFGLAGP